MTLQQGTVQVSITGHDFRIIHIVSEIITRSFSSAGPMRDDIEIDAVCRTLVLRVSGQVDGAPKQRPLEGRISLDVDGLSESQARVCFTATDSGDLRSVISAIAAELPLGNVVVADDGTAVLTVTS
jgi:hypothetical protein